MKPVAEKEISKQLYNCSWIIERAKELKALLSYNDPKMVARNKTRALSGIDTMMEALEELKEYVSGQETPAAHMPPPLFTSTPSLTRGFMFTMPPFGKLAEEIAVCVEYWQQSEPGIMSYRVYVQPKWGERSFIGKAVCRCPVPYDLNLAEEEASAILVDLLQNKLIMDGIQDWYGEQEGNTK